MFWEGIKLCLGMGGGMAAFDFSILHLHKPVQFDSKVQPVCLPKDNSSLAGDFLVKKELRVSGWGKTEQGIKSSKLIAVEIPGISNKRCAEILDPIEPNKIETFHLCAGNLGKNFSGSCSGDSGGMFIKIFIVLTIANYYI